MSRIVLIVSALIAASWTTSVEAADLGYGQPYTVNQPLNMYSWAGPYLGGNIGWDWGSVDNNPTRPSGLVGGAQAGYNWQTGPWVFGIEGDLEATGASDTFAPWKFSNPWFGTVRGRAGVAINNVLVYGTAGLAYGELTADTAANLSESHTSFGWVAGAGAEVGLTPQWSAKAEWLYLDFANRGYSVTGTNNGLAANLLRLGVNYHF